MSANEEGGSKKSLAGIAADNLIVARRELNAGISGSLGDTSLIEDLHKKTHRLEFCAREYERAINVMPKPSQQLAESTHQRNLLAGVLKHMLVTLGVIREGSAPNGPELIMAANSWHAHQEEEADKVRPEAHLSLAMHHLGRYADHHDCQESMGDAMGFDVAYHCVRRVLGNALKDMLAKLDEVAPRPKKLLWKDVEPKTLAISEMEQNPIANKSMTIEIHDDPSVSERKPDYTDNDGPSAEHP